MKELTHGEEEVYNLLCAGSSREEIGRLLDKTHQAVKTMCQRIVRKGYCVPTGIAPSLAAQAGKWHCAECQTPISEGSRRCRSCSRRAVVALTSRWTCIEDPEGVYTGRTVKDFGHTLKDGYWPAGSVWTAEAGGVAQRVVECKVQFLEPA